MESLPLAFLFTRYLNPLRIRAGARLAVVVNSIYNGFNCDPCVVNQSKSKSVLSLESRSKSYPYVGEMIHVCRRNESRRTEM